MSTVMDPLRDEHATLLPHIERLRTTADAVGDAPLDEVRALVDERFEFLVHHLIPHARAEDKALYPMVQQVMGAPTATATMSRDHIEVDHLTRDLGGLRDRLAASSAVPSELARELRRVLYGLYALVKAHFAKEEEIYLPLLDAGLTASEATRLFSQMEAAAGVGHEH